jgi:hypothetical protein
MAGATGAAEGSVPLCCTDGPGIEVPEVCIFGRFTFGTVCDDAG